MKIAIAPFFLLIIIGLIVGVFLIYFMLYKKNVNKALQENNGKHIALPDVNSMASRILIIILFIVLFSTKSQIGSLESNMDTLYSGLYNRIISLEATVNEMRDTLEQLKQSGNLVSNYDYSFENFNVDDMTADLKLEVALKSFNKNTSVAISLDDNVVELKKAPSGKFKGSLTISIFDIVENVTALISDGETTESVALSDIYMDSIWMEFLPSINSKFMGDPTYKDKKLYCKDDMYIYLSNTDTLYFTDVYIEIFADNKYVKTIDIDYSKEQTEYEFTIDEVIDVSDYNSMLDVYIIGKDNAGLTHKYISYSGNESSSVAYGMSEEIYDSKGNKLISYYE